MLDLSQNENLDLSNHRRQLFRKSQMNKNLKMSHEIQFTLYMKNQMLVEYGIRQLMPKPDCAWSSLYLSMAAGSFMVLAVSALGLLWLLLYKLPLYKSAALLLSGIC